VHRFFQIWLKSDANNRYFKRRPKFVSAHISKVTLLFPYVVAQRFRRKLWRKWGSHFTSKTHLSIWSNKSYRYTVWFYYKHNSSQLLQCACICAISGFFCDVEETCALLGNYAAESGNYVPTFRDNLSVPSSRVKMCCPEMSVQNYHCTLRNIPEEHISWYISWLEGLSLQGCYGMLIVNSYRRFKGHSAFIFKVKYYLVLYTKSRTPWNFLNDLLFDMV
jgi:hypothetical protein